MVAVPLTLRVAPSPDRVKRMVWGLATPLRLSVPVAR